MKKLMAWAFVLMAGTCWAFGPETQALIDKLRAKVQAEEAGKAPGSILPPGTREPEPTDGFEIPLLPNEDQLRPLTLPEGGDRYNPGSSHASRSKKVSKASHSRKKGKAKVGKPTGTRKAKGRKAAQVAGRKPGTRAPGSQVKVSGKKPGKSRGKKAARPAPAKSKKKARKSRR